MCLPILRSCLLEAYSHKLKYSLRRGIEISKLVFPTRRKISNAGLEGVEPSSKVLETSILPLNYRPKRICNVDNKSIQHLRSNNQVIFSHFSFFILFELEITLKWL